MKMLHYIKANKNFFKAVLCFLLVSIVYLLVYGKSGSFISLNSYHSFWLNKLFTYYTYFGDGIFSLFITAIVLFYFRKKELAFAIFFGFLISGIVVQFIKKTVESPRPKLFFEPGQYSYFLEGVTHASNTSFPSGHTATAFALVTIASILITNKKLSIVFLAAAVLEGYSRIYLAQHFLLDVIVGAIIGVSAAFPAIYLAKNSNHLKNYFQKTYTVPFRRAREISSIQST